MSLFDHVGVPSQTPPDKGSLLSHFLAVLEVAEVVAASRCDLSRIVMGLQSLSSRHLWCLLFPFSSSFPIYSLEDLSRKVRWLASQSACIHDLMSAKRRHVLILNLGLYVGVGQLPRGSGGLPRVIVKENIQADFQMLPANTRAGGTRR